MEIAKDAANSRAVGAVAAVPQLAEIAAVRGTWGGAIVEVHVEFVEGADGFAAAPVEGAVTIIVALAGVAVRSGRN